MNVRPIQCNDYYKDYLTLLEQLTTVEKEKISHDDFKNFVNKLSNNHVIIVIEEDEKIIATATLIIENKIIHNMGKVGHIEDVVTDKNIRGKGLGKMLINELIKISEKENCYKIILDCNEDNVKFYEKTGFFVKELQMSKYL